MHECAESQQQQQEAICVAILGTLHTKISRIFCLPLDVNRNSSRFLSSTLYTHPLYMSPMVWPCGRIIRFSLSHFPFISYDVNQSKWKFLSGHCDAFGYTKCDWSVAIKNNNNKYNHPSHHHHHHIVIIIITIIIINAGSDRSRRSIGFSRWVSHTFSGGLGWFFLAASSYRISSCKKYRNAPTTSTHFVGQSSISSSSSKWRLRTSCGLDLLWIYIIKYTSSV